MAQWVGRQPAKLKVAGSIPGQGMCLGYGPGPRWEHGKDNLFMFLLHINISLPFFHSLPSSLSLINK